VPSLAQSLEDYATRREDTWNLLPYILVVRRSIALIVHSVAVVLNLYVDTPQMARQTPGTEVVGCI
jgi:hypothetical protein